MRCGGLLSDNGRIRKDDLEVELLRESYEKLNVVCVMGNGVTQRWACFVRWDYQTRISLEYREVTSEKAD